MEKQLRRYKNMLVISGWGMIILGIWPILQMVMFIFLMPKEFNSMMEQYGLSGEVRIFVILFLLVYLGIDLLFRVLAGRAAIREGTGKKRSAACIVFGVLVLVVTILAVIYYYKPTGFAIADMDALVSVIIYFFMLYVNVQLLVSAIYIRAIERKQKRSHCEKEEKTYAG